MNTKTLLAAAALVAAAMPTTAADVGVSVTVSEPGLYGRIDIGRVPAPPVLVYPQPVVVVPAPVAVQRQPIYLHVPPGHAKDWKKHCGKYNACGQPVYFVREDWYQQHYASAKGSGKDRGKDKDRGGHGKGHKHD